MHINEIEEYLGILWANKCSLEIQVAEAEEQIGMVREVLNSNGILEVSLSDDESTYSIPCSPTLSGITDLGVNSRPDGFSTMSHFYPRHSGTPDSSSSSLSNYPRNGWMETGMVQADFASKVE